mmetsp:Transcript_5306/g.22506  ORF Transcript_5306/g.22506 Transcript_5306/m.22506 type:complete len:236 (+) Transcript_5306:828-1535(+)
MAVAGKSKSSTEKSSSSPRPPRLARENDSFFSSAASSASGTTRSLNRSPEPDPDPEPERLTRSVQSGPAAFPGGFEETELLSPRTTRSGFGFVAFAFFVESPRRRFRFASEVFSSRSAAAAALVSPSRSATSFRNAAASRSKNASPMVECRAAQTSSRWNFFFPSRSRSVVVFVLYSFVDALAPPGRHNASASSMAIPPFPTSRTRRASMSRSRRASTLSTSRTVIVIEAAKAFR